MSIRSTLKKEGIHVIGQLNTFEVNKIASSISEKICKAFPEHNINQSDLFISISRLNMYIADMTKDTALAKYFFKNNSIYFNKNIDFNNLGTLAIHECIHFMQELRNKNGKLLRFGLYDMQSGKHHGMAINEASVQLMASIANNEPLDTVKYYNLELTTESPDYYPIETAILKQLIYFTGSYPLFHSTLFSNDVFKNTVVQKTNLKTYNKIESNMDLIMHYEEKLNATTNKLAYCAEGKGHIAKLKKLNGEIDALKELIFSITLDTQNTILVESFNKQFENIRTLNDIKKFQADLYNFKNVTINTGNYNFYNEYYCDMMNKLDEKREFLEKYGDILTYESLNKDISLIQEETYGFQFFKKLFDKLSLLTEEFFRAKEY